MQQFTSKCVRVLSIRRSLSTTTYWQSVPFSPAPPRLPEHEQKIFEELQKSATGPFSTSKSPTASNISNVRQKVNQSPQTRSQQSPESEKPAPGTTARVKATGEGDELHPDGRRGAPPEFEGEINPKTGEVGGPKNDPLRWNGDWSYNGRVTDF